MEFTDLFIEEKFLESVGWSLAHSVWQIFLISLLLWLILKIIPTKKSPLRYGVALAALVLMCSASSWTFVHYLHQDEKSKSQISSIIKEKIPQSNTSGIFQTLSNENAIERQEFGEFLTMYLGLYLPSIVNLWIVGACFFFVRFIGNLYDLEKLHKQHHKPISLPLLKKVDNLTASLGIFRKVKVLKSSLVNVPITYGLFKPMILLPASLVLSIHPAQLEAIIAHELAHIKRYDYLANLFQSTLEVFFFFHPSFWWINAVIHEERENATDDLALSIGVRPQDLAYGLAEVANHSSYSPPEMTLAASKGKNRTLQRIKRILGKSTPPLELSPLITVTMILTLIISTILLVGAKSSDSNPRELPLLLTHLKSQTLEWTDSMPTRSSSGVVVRAAQDTVPSKKSIKDPKRADMPTLELTPVPQMDFILPEMVEIPPVPPVSIEPFSPVVPQKIRVHGDSIGKIVKELVKLKDENSPEAQARVEALKSALAHLEQNMEVISQAFEVKMEEWQDKHGQAMEKFETEMEDWEEKMEAHEKIWEASIAPKLKDFEEKIKEWEKENAPRIKEFEKKMKDWEEKNRDK